METFNKLTGWLYSSNKPAWQKHRVASTIVSILIGHQADSHDLSISVNTLSEMCLCGPTHTKDEIKFLQAEGWVIKTPGSGGANWLLLTDKYLQHLHSPTEVTEDAKSFAKWFRQLQRQDWKHIRPRNQRRANDPKREHSRLLTATQILKRCGSMERAKVMSEFAVTHHKTEVIQSIYNLQSVMNRPSFATEFEAFEKSGITPPPPPVALADETPADTLTRLTQTFAEEQERLTEMKKSKKTGDKIQEQETVVTAAEEALARHAMGMGIDPISARFPVRDWMKYSTMFKAEYQQGVSQ